MSWPIVTLGEVAVFINGDRGKNYPSKGSFVESGVAFINAGSLSLEHRVVDSELNFITQEKYDSLRSGKIERGDILFCLRGSLGKFAVIENDLKGAIASSLVIIRANDKITLSYLKHYLGSVLCAKEIDTFENGAAQPNLSATDLKSFKIPLPPLDEQKRIAAILDKADAIRQKRKQAIALADEFLRSVFLDMFGDPVSNPKGWEVKPLSELIMKGDKINYGIVQPGDHVEDGIPIVRVGDIKDGSIDKSKLKRVARIIDEKHSKSRLVGDEILITCVGATVGKVALADASLSGFNTVRALTRVRLNEEVNRSFVFRYLQSPFIQGYFQSQLRTVGQPTLNGKQIGETPILLPNLNMQREFLQLSDMAQTAKDLSNSQLIEADNMFNALSQKAFSGQL
ncbi:TPA: restriction endonuclease subunit S [Vibrio vulnificus]